MAEWPNSLPIPLVENVSYTPGENVISSQMDAGAAKRRRRFTAVPESVTFRLLIDPAQLQTLQEFVAITLADVLPFDWREFRKPNDLTTAAQYRFRSRPVYSYVGPGLWYADLDLELLTTFQGTFLLDVDPLTT